MTVNSLNTVCNKEEMIRNQPSFISTLPAVQIKKKPPFVMDS